MDSFSEVKIRGRVAAGKTKDGKPGDVLRQETTKDGRLYWRFSVGVERKRGYDKATGQSVVETDWFLCSCWDEKILSLNLQKGDVVLVTGRLQTYGEKVEGSDLLKTRISVVAERVQKVIDPNASWAPIPSGSALPSGSQAG